MTRNIDAHVLARAGSPVMATIFGPDGRPVELDPVQPRRRTIPHGVSAVAPAPYNDRFQARAGSQLTPRYILAQLMAADSGLLYGLVDLLEEALEMDGHLQAVVEKRVDWLAAAPWEVYADGSSMAAREAAAFCREVLEEATGSAELSLDFPQLIAHLQMAVYYPVMAAEAIWKRSRRWMTIDHWNAIHPRRLAFATDWNMHVWNVSPGGPSMGRAAPAQRGPSPQSYPGLDMSECPGKFVRHRALVRPGGYPTRDGMGRLTIWFAAFKRWSNRDKMAFAEQYARGLRAARYVQSDMQSGSTAMKGAIAEDIAAMEEALQKWSSAVSLVYPNSFDQLSIQHTQGTGVEIYRMIDDVMNVEMSKALLGSTLSTDPGRKGARSLGDTHVEVEERKAVKDAKNAAKTVRRDIFAPLIRMNFRGDVPIPRIHFDTPSIATRYSRARFINTALLNGMRVPEVWAHEQVGIPQPAMEADVNGLAQVQRTLIPVAKASK